MKIPEITPETADEAAAELAAARQPRSLRVTPASQVRLRRVLWLWDNRIVLGGLTLLAGREGIGKSTVAADVTAATTRGQLAGEHKGTPRAVIYVHSEDARDYTIVPRLTAAGADLDLVLFVDAITRNADDGSPDLESPLVLPLDVDRLADVVRQHSAALVVLDAATSVIDQRLDGDRDRQMRQGLEAIARGIGHDTGCAVLGIVHFGKRESADTGKLILGSIAWSQVARSVLAVASDKDTGELIVSPTKANLGAGAPSLTARIVTAEVDTDDGPTSVGRVEWTGETDRNARDLLGSPEEADDRTELNAAADWLRDYLTASDRAPSKDAKKHARDAGFSERTLARARKHLSVEIRMEGFPRQSYWSLPRADSSPDASGAGGANPAQAHVGVAQLDSDGTTGNPQVDDVNEDLHPHSRASGAIPTRARATDGTTGTTDGELAPRRCRWCVQPLPADTPPDVLGHLGCRPARAV